MKFLALTKATIAIIALITPATAVAENILSIEVDGATHQYDYETLGQMGLTTVRTENDYVDSVTSFSGPLLRDILLALNVDASETLTMRALNDFTVTVPAKDAYEYPVILALTQNGDRMSVREKGPIWLIYPMSDHPELQDDVYNSRLIWQLATIEVD